MIWRDQSNLLKTNVLFYFSLYYCSTTRYVIGSEYTADPAVEACLDDCERVLAFHLQMPFQDSSYYNCDPNDNPSLSGNCSNGFCGQTDETQAWREISVHIPASYNDGDEIGVLVVTDSQWGSISPDGQFGSLFLMTKSASFIPNVMENLMNSNDDERSLPMKPQT